MLSNLFRACIPEAGKQLKERKHLTTLTLACLIFFDVSGGPYGTEDSIGAVGAKYTLIGFIVLPIIWCIPEALITAEYATAFPEAAGTSTWVGAAFGPFWAWLAGWFAAVSGTIDAAAYPVLMVSYLKLQWTELDGGWQKIFALCFITVVLFTANWLGLEVVGMAQVINAIFVLSPFVVLFFWCIPDWDVSKWGKVNSPLDWETWITIMFWNLNYWSYAANVAGETVDSARTLPRALLLAIAMVSLGYLLPLAATTAVLSPDSEWDVGFLGQAANTVAGRWLMVWVVVAAIVSSLGLFLATVTTTSYLLHGLGQRGFLPKAFAHRGRFDTPTLAIWVQMVPVMLLVHWEFEAILEMVNATFSATLLITFAAAVWLRIKNPGLHRPYRIPVNTPVLVLVLLPGAALLVWVLVIPFYLVQKKVMYCIIGATVLGLLLYPVISSPAVRRVLPFNDLDTDWFRPPLTHGLPLEQLKGTQGKEGTEEEDAKAVAVGLPGKGVVVAQSADSAVAVGLPGKGVVVAQSADSAVVTGV